METVCVFTRHCFLRVMYSDLMVTFFIQECLIKKIYALKKKLFQGGLGGYVAPPLGPALTSLTALPMTYKHVQQQTKGPQQSCSKLKMLIKAHKNFNLATAVNYQRVKNRLHHIQPSDLTACHDEHL